MWVVFFSPRQFLRIRCIWGWSRVGWTTSHSISLSLVSLKLFALVGLWPLLSSLGINRRESWGFSFSRWRFVGQVLKGFGLGVFDTGGSGSAVTGFGGKSTLPTPRDWLHRGFHHFAQRGGGRAGGGICRGDVVSRSALQCPAQVWQYAGGHFCHRRSLRVGAFHPG